MNNPEILFEILKDGEPHTPNELIRKLGIKDKDNLISTVYQLRKLGHVIEHPKVNRDYCYKLVKFVRGSQFWPCMILKAEWPMCRHKDCRHYSKCGAAI